MKSQATVALGQSLELIEAATPTPVGKEVLLEMGHCGIVLQAKSVRQQGSQA